MTQLGRASEKGQRGSSTLSAREGARQALWSPTSGRPPLSSANGRGTDLNDKGLSVLISQGPVKLEERGKVRADESDFPFYTSYTR